MKMTQESGRSLIEIIGVMAIAGVMTVAAFRMYAMIRNNQTRTIATAELKQLAADTKMLMGVRGTYEGVSVDYLVKAGALKNTRQPIGGDAWSVTSAVDGNTFSINLVGLTSGECEYFTTKVPTWATALRVNGYETEPESHCFSSATNEVSFIVE